MLPASPQIFHGREGELQELVGLLLSTSARVAILGTGGMGKTSLAIAALHHADVVANYAQRYFIPCQLSATCADLLHNIASHIGIEEGPNMLRRIMHHFMGAGSTLLVLDNLETPWEPSTSRGDVEDLLSRLTDIAHVALMVSLFHQQVFIVELMPH